MSLPTSITAREVYTALLKHYGKQGWWPVTPSGGLSPKYHGGPKNARQQLEVIVGAVLTQNTSWTNVEKAILQLNKNDMIDIERLCRVRHSRLARLIRSSGYFNEKAKKLKTVAYFLLENPIAKLSTLPRTKSRELLLGVKGIGPETADSILLYALDKPIFVVDAYTKRIFSRIGLISKDSDYHSIQTIFENNLRRNSRTFNEYHALIVEHGKNICKKTPLCDHCVLLTKCKQRL